MQTTGLNPTKDEEVVWARLAYKILGIKGLPDLIKEQITLLDCKQSFFRKPDDVQ